MGNQCKEFTVDSNNGYCYLNKYGCPIYDTYTGANTYSSLSEKVLSSKSSNVCTHKNVFNANMAIRDTCSLINAQEICSSNNNC